MKVDTFLDNLEREAKALDRPDPSFSMHNSQMNPPLRWLGGNIDGAPEFCEAIATLLPAGDELGQWTREAVRTIGHTAEIERTPPGRVVRIIAALALDRIEWEKTVAQQRPARKGKKREKEHA